MFTCIPVALFTFIAKPKYVINILYADNLGYSPSEKNAKQKWDDRS